jgi:hypothetical protein
VQVDNHLHEIEPDAGADNSGDVAAAEVALEQPAKVGGRNADAVVLDCDDGASFLGPRRADLALTGDIIAEAVTSPPGFTLTAMRLDPRGASAPSLWRSWRILRSG